MSTKNQLPKGFTAFILTESLGALNDNFFKTLVQLFLVNLSGRADAEKLLSLSTAVFTVPFVLLGPLSGYFSDRFSKKKVMHIIKVAEIGILILGCISFYSNNIPLMMFVIFLLATHSTFFAPAKAGFIPETCPHELITKANGIVGLTTFVSIIFGTAIAGVILDAHQKNTVVTSSYGIAFALAGTIAAFFMTRTHTGVKSTKLDLNPFSAIWHNLKFIKASRGLYLAALANSYFWLLGLVFQTNIMPYGKAVLHLSDAQNTRLSVLPALIGLGIAAGSILASRWSGKKVEIGLVPLGGIGLSLMGTALSFGIESYSLTLLFLFIAGLCGGIYYIPLQAYLQAESPADERGRILSTVGIMNGIFMVMGSGLYYLLAVLFKLSPQMIFLFMACTTLLVTFIICRIIPEYLVRFTSWLVTHTFYDITIKGQENIPANGAALLASNHVSFIDAVLISASIQRFIKFIMYKKIYEIPLVRFFCGLMEVIPIAPYEGRESVGASLKTARDKLIAGELVCIFPEGAITRDGEMHEFKGGLESIMQNVSVPIIPVYLNNVWGSIFSFESGKAFFKFPKKIPYPVTVTFGAALPAHATREQVRLAVAALGETGNENTKT